MELVTPDAGLRLVLARVRSGVAVGRMQSTSGTARVDCWTLFTGQDRFAACCDVDDLRFAHPLTFVQLAKGFRHVLDQPFRAP